MSLPEFEKYTTGTHYHVEVDLDAPPPRLELTASVVPAGSFVLDVGCHTGFFMSLLESRGCRVVGMERNAEAVVAGREKGLEIVEADAGQTEHWERVPFELDVVVMLDVLEHLYDPWGVLGNAHAHMRPGGTLLFSVPNVQSWAILRHLVRGSFAPPESGLHDPTHIRHFTYGETKVLASECGFRVVNVHPLWVSIPAAYRLEQISAAVARVWKSAWLRWLPQFAVCVPLVEARRQV